MRYLLDTNIVSTIMRDPNGAAGLRARPFAFGELFTSVVVLGELRFGIAKRQSAQLHDQLERVLEGLVVEPLTDHTAAEYARLRAELEREGCPIGSNDTWIAAHALALKATMVTANEREFRRVPGLTVENWAA